MIILDCPECGCSHEFSPNQEGACVICDCGRLLILQHSIGEYQLRVVKEDE